MSFISYAQNGEDVILWRALKQVENGFYIDIGACDPTDLSVTRAFYDRGWRGINVEPVAEYHARCMAERPRDLNLNVAVAARPGTLRFLNVPDTGLSTTVEAVAASAVALGWTVEERQVPARTLADICAEAATGEIHFLKIDVEGAEQAVLEGADFARFRPWIVLIEATAPLSTERQDHLWRGLLLDAGYEQAYFDGVNLYFVARERRELAAALAIPPNALDDYKPAALVGLEAQVAAARAASEQERQAKAALQARLAAAQDALEQERGKSAGLRARLEAMARALDQDMPRDQQGHAGIERLPGRLETHLILRAREIAALRTQVAELTNRLDSLFASTSWRVTAPLRVTRRMLPAQRARHAPVPPRAAPTASPAAPSPSPAPPPPEPAPLRPRRADMDPKELARQVFHRGMRLILGIPGGPQGVRLVRSVAPRPVDWLALRYRAYQHRASLPPPAATGDMSKALASLRIGTLDISEEETRLYRQFATSGLSKHGPVRN